MCVCVCGFSFVSLLFSQQQLKNLQAALGSRLEESLCIINEKVPFNDTSTYCLGLGILFDFFFLGYPSGGRTPYELKCISCKKCWTSEQTLGGNCSKYSWCLSWSSSVILKYQVFICIMKIETFEGFWVICHLSYLVLTEYCKWWRNTVNLMAAP